MRERASPREKPESFSRNMHDTLSTILAKSSNETPPPSSGGERRAVLNLHRPLPSYEGETKSDVSACAKAMR